MPRFDISRFPALKLQWSAYKILALLFIVFCLSSIDTWYSGYGWHDQQRICQLLLLWFVALFVPFLPKKALPKPLLLLLVVFFSLGLCSSLLAKFPEWAFREWGRYVGLLLLSLLVSGLSQRQLYSSLIFWMMAAVGLVHAYQFFLYYVMAFVTGIHMLDADMLYSGFSNPRFLGQFQVMLLPVLALLLSVCCRQRQWGLSLLLLFSLIAHWCITFSLGGRGVWLGLLVAHITLVLLDYRYWRVPALQMCAALLGFSLYLLFFKLIPLWLGIDLVLPDNLRTTLSGRERIWQIAWEMALANPWLGVGPMHYSATYNPIAAHPHQVVLQFLSEWGFPAAIIFIAMIFWAGYRSVSHLRRSVVNEVDAGLWLAIVGALVLAQVDGVFVMPYAETWLASLLGLALARCGELSIPPRFQQLTCIFVCVPVLIVLGKVLVGEAPAMFSDSIDPISQHHGGNRPRFWSQGWLQY
ncbi:O-antigen ligase family protein [Pseudomonas sp. WHRI 8822A]|uniref:O-antigen ligase family protein n=1 Tax=Pseudomonas sp. WHRI 8822A TaxID=3162568 RepID=UPI0032EC7150